MGSKQVREAHLLRYGATLSDLNNPRRPRSTCNSQQSLERLSSPKRVERTTKVYMRKKEQVERGMKELFPPHQEVDEVAEIESGLPYPEDWRRTPSEASSDKPIKWLYGCLNLARPSSTQNVTELARQLVERMLREHGALPVNELTTRREVRAMLRSGDRYGVLIDILATRRSVLSGYPHELASELYKFVDTAFPIYVKFMFVGVTDNGTKRVARDIFNSDVVAGCKKLPFTAIDSEHLYVVHPKGDEGAIMRERGHEVEEEKRLEHIRRHCTPKFVPPPPPSWLCKLKEEKSASEATQSAQSFVTLDKCPRCWLFGHARSPSPSNPTRPSSNLPTTKPNIPTEDQRDSSVPVSFPFSDLAVTQSLRTLRRQRHASRATSCESETLPARLPTPLSELKLLTKIISDRGRATTR